MRAIQVNTYGGPDALRLVDVDASQPGPGQVLVDVAASGVNYMDTYQRSGLYQVPLPLRLGVEGAGTVAAVGEGVTDLAAGDRVAWVAAQGSYAERGANAVIGVDLGYAPVPATGGGAALMVTVSGTAVRV